MELQEIGFINIVMDLNILLHIIDKYTNRKMHTQKIKNHSQKQLDLIDAHINHLNHQQAPHTFFSSAHDNFQFTLKSTSLEHLDLMSLYHEY